MTIIPDMPSDSPSSGLPAGLASTAQDHLRAFFTHANHHPSASQWTAIRDLLDHLERAAHGALDAAVYLSAIPAGTGKTTSLVAFSRALAADPTHAATGILITVNRITEAADTAQALVDAGLSDRLCVYTSDPLVNALGRHADANFAQVCVSTQAALKQTLKAIAGQPFDAASRFHFLGRRRAVVCWDESFAFNRPVTLDADTVVGLARPLRYQSDEAANTLMTWAAELARATDGLCVVPDFMALGVDFRRLEDDVGDQDELVTQAKGLAIMSGGQGYAARGDFGRPTLITHYPELPPSLMPVLVTDASARVNQSYKHMALKVPVVWMKDAEKTYRNMDIRIVPVAASRSVYRDRKTFRGRELIDMAARYIRSVAPEEVLVVSYKTRMVIKEVTASTIQDAIDARLSDTEKWTDKAPRTRRVHHLTWGRHTASNAFKHVGRVLLMGLNFLPRPAGHAAAGAALDLDLLKEHPSDVQIEETQRGMLKDATLQALLRGSARMGVDGDCGVMEVVIPQTIQTGLTSDDYLSMFPGVRIRTDAVLMPPKPLTGKLKELSAIVVRRLQAGETELSHPSLYAELGMRQPHYVRLLKKPEWTAYTVAAGLQAVRLPGRTTGLRRVA